MKLGGLSFLEFRDQVDGVVGWVDVVEAVGLGV